MNTMKSFVMACALLAVAITALPADDVVAEALPVDVAPETELYVEQLHKEASDDIASLMEAGKTKDACSTLADSSIKEITDGQRNTQRLVNRMDVGKNCHTAGLAAYNSAKKAEGNSKTNYNSAKKAASKAKSAPIKFRQPVTVSMVKTSGCLDVSKDPDYIKAKKATSSASNKATLAKGKVENAKKATSNALKAHQKAKVDCACRAQKNYKAAVKATSNFNSAKNAKAWTKAHHMKCVLSGKPANKCAVPRVPRVTAPRMPSWVARTKCSSGGGKMHCKMTAKGSNHAGVVKPSFPGGGYQLVGGGINNHYRSFNHLSSFEEAFPHGNHFQCDTGFGAGRLTCYAMYCKKSGMRCTTKRSSRQRKSGTQSVNAPRGYTMTGGGLYNHYRHFNKRAHFERSHPNGNGWIGDMGAGWGDYTVSVRACTGLACTTRHSGVGNSKVVTCPSGYKVTSCGSHQMNGWGKLGAFEQYNFHGNGCHCDMGFGSGKQRCYARCCK
jgi:hypothetical protein